MCEAADADADAVVCNQTHTPEFPTPPLQLSVQLPQSTTPPSSFSPVTTAQTAFPSSVIGIDSWEEFKLDLVPS
ncbi:hypothetical protein V6N11_067254 [Hibiscus sabdariffa]|uniref:Uncharacterized protein n=2 Tax=Hibiscus sabdariffa TaxID=183260 RepID=A0ABR1Z6N6_9ROSI